MPLSYKIIKNHQVGLQEENFKIPVTPAKTFKKQQNNLSLEEMKNHDKINSQIQSEVDGIIQEAKIKAKEMVNQASRKAQDIQQKAYDTGYQKGMGEGQQKGYQQGYEKSLEETKGIKKQARDLLQQAHKASREYIHQTQEEIIDLAVTIAKSVIHHTIDLKDENILEMINFALRSVEDRRQILMRCHPKDISFLKKHVSSFKKICPQATFTLLEDKEIREKDCVIETEAQIINLKIDEQIENIRQILLEMRQTDEV